MATKEKEKSKTSEVASVTSIIYSYKDIGKVAWIVLLVGLIITAVLSFYMKANVERIAKQDFSSQCSEIRNAISNRLDDHARILMSGAALFNASETVTSNEWHVFNREQRIEKQLPGIQGIGFSLLIPRAELTRHIEKIRSEGFPDYNVKPEGDREIYSSIIFLEPFSGRNLRAFGYDMFSEPVRRTAMERARDTDSAALSGKVVLIQENGEEVQAGTLMYVPVYNKGMPIDSVEQRRAAIHGWVYSPYRMNDLMNGILENSKLKEKQLSLKVFDGEQPSKEGLLCEIYTDEEQHVAPRFVKLLPIEFNGHFWTLSFTQSGGGFFTAEYLDVWLTMIGGLFITLLLFTLIHRDISARRRVEDILRQSEERYAMTLNAVNDGLWDWNVPSGHVFFSTLYYTLLGYEDGEFPATYNSWRLLVHPEDIDRIEREIQKSIEIGKGFFFDFRMKEKSGEWLWVCVRGKTIELNADGKALRMVGTLSNIAERKRLEAENARLEEQNRKIQKAESLNRMSGAIAHHFNNQLHVVMGYLDMVIGDLSPGDSHIAELTTALQAARNASEVSGHLLVYLGQKQVKLESLDLAKLCRMSLPIIQAARPQNVTLKTNLPSPGPWIKADAKQIQQILTNLVINAWEAIGDNTGTVHIILNTVSPSDIPASHRFPIEWQSQEQHYACLEVIDSGCGIQEKDMDKLFDPFFSTKFTGRGLGLSVVLGIMKTHEAAITVESRIGGGSVFKVFFPLKTPSNLSDLSDRSDKSDPSDKSAKGGTVLLVEDEDAVRKMTTTMLASFGFTVLQAKDGIEAVEVFKQHKDEISCVCCDLTMPRMGGWETIYALKAMRRDLPVILASGYDEATVMAGVHPELPDFFLNKPYELDKLRNAIAHAVERSNL